MSTYASFQGRVYLGKRDINGNPIEVRSPGNVADLKLSLKTDVLEHYESQAPRRPGVLRPGHQDHPDGPDRGHAHPASGSGLLAAGLVGTHTPDQQRPHDLCTEGAKQCLGGLDPAAGFPSSEKCCDPSTSTTTRPVALNNNKKSIR